jgi:hypothetical protein|tara:strand:- start:380 stop:610 length:231 start_codon:yes stop_codon:yes gene_type:complete
VLKICQYLAHGWYKNVQAPSIAARNHSISRTGLSSIQSWQGSNVSGKSMTFPSVRVCELGKDDGDIAVEISEFSRF